MNGGGRIIARRRARLGVVCLALLGASDLPDPTAAYAAQSCVSGTEAAPRRTPWAQERLGADVIVRSFQGWRVVVAVIGSGVDGRHPQLQGRVDGGAAVGTTADPAQDCLGFGTATAGAIAAGPVTGTPLRGLAPQVRIVPIRLPDWVAHPTTGLRADEAAQAGDLIAEAIGEAVRRGAQIVVLPSTAVADTAALRQAASDAEQAGALLVQGARSGRSAPDASYPLAYPEVLGVAAHAADGTLVETPAGFDIAAPGADVETLLPGTPGYATVTDPAVAAGYVAGAAALLLDAGGASSPLATRRRLVGSGLRVHGAPVPYLSPASALGPAVPDVAVPAGPAGPAGLTAPPARATPSADEAAAFVSLGCLAFLVLAGLTAVAHRRGTRRDWHPAEPVDPAAVIPTPPRRSI